MLCPQSRSAVAIGPIAASDTDTALLLRRLRPYLLPVARLPRAPALVRLGHAAACLVGGVAGAVAAPLRRLDRLGAPDSAALAGLAGGAARSEERRVGKECVRTCRSRGSPSQYKKKHKNKHTH